MSSIPKAKLDAILDSVEKALDNFKTRLNSGDCGDLELFVAQMKLKAFAISGRWRARAYYGEGKRDLFK